MIPPYYHFSTKALWMILNTHMTIYMVNQLKQFSIVRSSKIKAMTCFSHKALQIQVYLFDELSRELTIKVMYLAPQYLAF